MIASQDQIAKSPDHQIATSDERALLGLILGSHAPLSEIAAEFDTTVLAIAEWMELPHVQHWLALIERAATTRARVQAAEMRTNAVAALDRVLMESTCHTDRDRQTTQRTATALLRASVARLAEPGVPTSRDRKEARPVLQATPPPARTTNRRRNSMRTGNQRPERAQPRRAEARRSAHGMPAPSPARASWAIISVPGVGR